MAIIWVERFNTESTEEEHRGDGERKGRLGLGVEGTEEKGHYGGLRGD